MKTKNKIVHRIVVATVLLTTLLSLLGIQAPQEVRAQEGIPPETSVTSPPLQPGLTGELAPMEVGIQSVIGTDDRLQITNTTDAPWRRIAQLISVYPGGSASLCTGFFIGPYTVATAGHCVFNHDIGETGAWATNVYVTPGLNGGSAPYGTVEGYLLYSTQGWTEGADPLYDYGAVQLLTPLGATTGTFDFAYFSDSYLTAHMADTANISGYPGDKSDPVNCPMGGCQQWWNAQPLTLFTQRVLSYEIDTFGGQSGAPIWVTDGSDQYVIGIHAYGVGSTHCNSGDNCGVRISPDVAENFITWSAQTPHTDCQDLTLTYTGMGSAPTAVPTNSAGCGTHEYTAGTTVNLTANPAIGYSVVSWTGTNNDASQELTNTVTMPASAHTAAANYIADGSLLGPGTYDDPNAALAYVGSWTSYSGSGPYLNSLHFSSAIGSEVAFAIDGNSFRLIYSAYSNRGTAEIYVDGALYQTINQYEPTLAWQRTWTSGILPGTSPHLIRIVHKTGSVVDVDAITVLNTAIPPPLPPGTHDNKNSSILYSGSWSAYTGSGPYLNTLNYSSLVGSEAYFSINGNSFRLTYTANTNRGLARIYVDGALYQTINQNSASLAWQQSWTSGILPGPTPHTIRIVHDSGSTIDVDAIAVMNTTPPLPLELGTVDDASPSLIFSGNWATYSGAGPYLNTLHYSNATGNEAVFAINGNSFRLTYTANTARGTVGIYVDGALYQTLNQYSATTVWQKTWTSGILPGATPHDIRIVHASGGIIDVDAITVLDSTPPPPLDPGTYDDAHSSITYNGSWVTYSGAGPLYNTLHYSNATGSEALFVINGNSLRLTYTGSTNRGMAAIYVDGELYHTLNQYSATTVWKKTWTSDILPGSAPHTIRIVHLSGAVIDVDAITVSQLTPLPLGTHDDTHSSITYTGTWVLYNGSGPYNNTLHYSSAINSEALFIIDGAKFTLTYTSNSARGTIEIYVDGELYHTLNQYNATTIWQQTWTSAPLGTGQHTIRIVHKTGGYVDIDAVTVTASTDPTPPGTIDDLSAVQGSTMGSVDLAWTATGDDGVTGSATSYQVRYAATAINSETAWNAATAVTTGVPAPLPAGTSQSMTVSGLTPGNTYYFAIRAVDEESNRGPLSPSPSAVAKPPAGLLPGTYDDPNAWITYTGTWSTYAGSGPYNNTLHYSTATGSQAAFPIEGESFALTFTANPSRGTAEIYVDDVLYHTLNQYASTTVWKQTWTSGLLPGPTPHAIRIVHATGSTIDVDAVQVTQLTPLPLGTKDDSYAGILYAGRWSTYSGSGPYSNTMHFSTTVGEEAIFSINGNRFALTYTASSNRGTAEIYVDGALYHTLNQYSATTLWQQAWYSRILPGPAPHTVRIVHTAGSVIDVDAVTSYQIAPLSAGTHDNPSSGILYTGTWSAYTGSGPYNNTMHYSTAINSEASFIINGASFRLTYTTNSIRGTMEIYVDGALYHTLDAYSATLMWQQTWTSGDLGAGPHIIRIVHKTGSIIDVDAVTVYP
ncbi:MAG: trypsin-like serine protease [Anaerolineales bacterium]|nr:trypsin-like serine protease [Anaerolineales bacterium]